MREREREASRQTDRQTDRLAGNARLYYGSATTIATDGVGERGSWFGAALLRRASVNTAAVQAQSTRTIEARATLPWQRSRFSGAIRAEERGKERDSLATESHCSFMLLLLHWQTVGRCQSAAAAPAVGLLQCCERCPSGRLLYHSLSLSLSLKWRAFGLYDSTGLLLPHSAGTSRD